MIKQSWNIGEEERKRILNLHETATKKLYLMSEQEEKKDEFTTLTEYNIPKNISFKFPLRYFNSPYSIETQTDDQNNVYVTWENEPHLIPKINEINSPKFKIDDNGYLEGVQEWSWLNSLNEFIGKNNPQDRRLFVPSYDRNLGLHFLFYVIKAIKKREAKKLNYSEDFFQANDNKYQVWNGGYYIVKGDDLPLFISGPTSGGTEPKIPENIPGEPVVLDITSPFVFDSIELVDSAKQEFNKFVQDVKSKYAGVKANVDVITSSSIDGDPDAILKNTKESRRDYDLHLSQRRADAIVEKLKQEIGIPTLNFIPKGIGQTSAYGPSWTAEKPTTPEQTKPNRRLIIKMPELKNQPENR